jgi:hypothetical protein
MGFDVKRQLAAARVLAPDSCQRGQRAIACELNIDRRKVKQIIERAA